MRIPLITFLIFNCLAFSYSQKNNDYKIPPRDWFLLDSKKDKVQGLSVDRAYKSLLKKKKSKTVVVAVIDSGVDIEHEDLEGKVWTNTDEIAGNGIDDDKNGYVDDVHGWNFLGSDKGEVVFETYEYVRIYDRLKSKYDTLTAIDTTSTEFNLFREVRDKYLDEKKSAAENLSYATLLSRNFEYFAELFKKKLDVDSLTIDDLDKVNATDSVIIMGKNFMTITYENYGAIDNFFEESAEYFSDQQKNLDIDADYRSIVGDNESDPFEKYYGNTNVKGPDADHGTHVAGIIAANRSNKLGNRGVAADVKIMAIRAVPDGDERDKDIANAIRYAADNGAQIINMSFGKDYSPNKHVVDSAVAYAINKGLLLIHAAGNDGENIDSVNNYPNRSYVNGNTAEAWIEVGASAPYLDEEFASDFSNYGQDVDVFAPGVDIYSTIPENKYEANDGTSMAGPMVTGVAALIMSYYPQLSAAQIKDVIIKSVRDFTDHKVYIPGSDNLTTFGKLSKTGGIVNAYEALKLADEMTNE